MKIKKPDSSWLHRANRVLAQGALTNSKRPSAYVQGVFPSHVVKGEGCYVYDYLGNKYLDFIGGLGCNLLGYGHPKITEAVAKVLSHGPSLSLPTTLEVELAERLVELTGFPKVRFYKTGTEACMAAVRMARAKDPGWLWSEGYHGWSDLFVQLTDPALGISGLNHISNTHQGYVTDRTEFMGTIVEPLMLDTGPKRLEWLKKLRETGVVIFDEIITGFRVPQNFVYKWWDVKPDILCLGKAMANGYPLAAVFMEDEYAEPEWFCSGTYCGELMSLAACDATLDELAKKKVDDLVYYGQRLQNNINKIVKDIGVELRGYGTRGTWDNEQYETALLMQELAKSGILIGRAHFYNYAHMESGCEEGFLSILTDVVNKIKQGVVKLEGEHPRNTFKR